MKLLYGNDNYYIDVYLKALQYFSDLSTKYIVIPASDHDRAAVFGDPLVNVLKQVKYIDNFGNETIYKHDQVAKLNDLNISSDIEAIIRLNDAHTKIKLQYGNSKEEYPEQLMAAKFIKPTDIVLEIGANIGRNSCMIGKLLNDSSNLVSVESDMDVIKYLEENRNNNGLHFHIEPSAISKRNMVQSGWTTQIRDDIPTGWKKVNTITLNQLMIKYNLKFNTIVADCEGAFYNILQDFPHILDNINTVIIENDYLDYNHYLYTVKCFEQYGFRSTYTLSGGWGVCYDVFYQVFSKLSY